MRVYISIVTNSDGQVDCEVLDSEPTESFRDDLWDGIAHGAILSFEIREGNINGGDSTILFASQG